MADIKYLLLFTGALLFQSGRVLRIPLFFIRTRKKVTRGEFRPAVTPRYETLLPS